MAKRLDYSHVIWDWNGTLFDDVKLCMSVINTLLSTRGLKTLDSIAEYHTVFTFPIIDYYRKVGFDFEKEPFEALAVEFMDLYLSGDSACGLFPGTKSVLSGLQQTGVRQVMLSASKQEVLLKQVSRYDIADYFDELLGISDIHANSKLEIARAFAVRKNLQKAVLIGDSTHDFEVAQALDTDCILIPNGHQSKETLLSCGASVLNDITYVPGFLST